MRKYVILIGLILGVCTSVFGEAPPVKEWAARYNGLGNSGDTAYALAVDGSGSIYVTGVSYGTNNDYATVKYDPNGTKVRVRRYNGTGNGPDAAYALAVDSPGNVYVTGYSTGTSKDYMTIKYDPDGNSLWEARYNGPGNSDDYARALAVDDSGNVYVTGFSTGSGTGYDYATIKYGADGNELWVRRYNGPGSISDYAYDLAVDDLGNVYVTGVSTGSGSGDYLTIKYTSDGYPLWVAIYDGPGNNYDYAYALAVDDSGNVYVTGTSDGGDTSYDYATIKYNADGSELWVRRYNSPGNGPDYANALVMDSMGNVCVSGESNNDYATVKYNPDGTELWVKRYDGPGNSSDGAYALAVDVLDNIYVTGFSTGSGGNNDYATIKYDTDGNPLWEEIYNGPGNGPDSARALAVDDSGNVYVTGGSYGSGANEDYATIKYSQENYCMQIPDWDLDGNCKVDIIDVALFADQWLDPFDFIDYAMLADNWLECELVYKGACW